MCLFGGRVWSVLPQLGLPAERHRGRTWRSAEARAHVERYTPRAPHDAPRSCSAQLLVTGAWLHRHRCVLTTQRCGAGALLPSPGWEMASTAIRSVLCSQAGVPI